MSLVASLMHAAEPIACAEYHAAEPIACAEYNDARFALAAVEKRLIENFVGAVRYNRFGHPFGGCHPALRIK